MQSNRQTLAVSLYQGYIPFKGIVGGCNGEFMSNMMLLKSGYCNSPVNNLHAGYRKFFYPDECWVITGPRLSEELQ